MTDILREFDNKEALERLRDIEEHEPVLGKLEFIKALCNCLADRLAVNSATIVDGFIVAFLLLIDDAKRGVDVPRALVGQHPMIYHMADRYRDAIAKVTFGEEFAELVKARTKELEAD